MVATELITGMEDIVQHIKDLEIKNKKLEEENDDNLASLNFYTEQCAELKDERKGLKEEMSAMKEALAEKFYKHYDDMGYNKLNIARTVGPNLGRMIEHLINENKKLQEKNEELQEERDEVWDELEKTKEEHQESDKHLNKCIDSIRDQYLEVKEENKELEMKSNAKSDIIKNMFECITADLEEVQDGGFYIKRDWGHKYIDAWNEIVTQEYKDALKEINEQLEGIEWETDGFQFDLNIVEEDSESEDE